MTRIYFAGPDIFHPDFKQHRDHIHSLCAQAGLTPLTPGDTYLEDAHDIFTNNIKMVDQADGLIANLDPFRGPVEPDSGTVFECAYAYARKKFVIAVVSDRRDILTKLKAAGAGPPDGSSGPCPDGYMVENFGLPLNLMLSRSVTALAAGLEEAVEMARSLATGGETQKGL
jgi:Nucleoside 2-deoxyribosyltransferase